MEFGKLRVPCTFNIVGGALGVYRKSPALRLEGESQCRASLAKTTIERTIRFSTSGSCNCSPGCAKTSSPISSPCCRIGRMPKTCFSRPAWCYGASSASFSRKAISLPGLVAWRSSRCATSSASPAAIGCGSAMRCLPNWPSIGLSARKTQTGSVSFCSIALPNSATTSEPCSSARTRTKRPFGN